MTRTMVKPVVMLNVHEDFRAAMRNAGLITDAEIIADGQLHRFHVEDDQRGSENGWYILHHDGLPAGAFGCWKRDIKQTWSSRADNQMTPAERAEFRQRIEAINAERENARREASENARLRANKIWASALPVVAHPYLRLKGIKPHGSRHLEDALVVPLTDTEGNLHSLQFIAVGGRKTFLTDGAIHGHHFLIGKPDAVLCIAEGFATGASIHEATGHAVAVAFNAGNLEPVAQALRKKYPNIRLILCADNDAWTKGNPGLTKARETAQAVDAIVAVPDFTDCDLTSKPTDFNDLARLKGAEVVRQVIVAAQMIAANEQENANLNKHGASTGQEQDKNRSCSTDTRVPAFSDTDVANAQRFALDHGQDVRFTPERGWLVWTGQRWQPDEVGEIMQKAKHTARRIFDEISNSKSSQQESELFRWARKSQSADRLKAMLFLAQSEPSIPTRLAQFDADLWFLNCQNGTLDLRTGNILPHRQEDLLCRITPIEYDAQADISLWASFLNRVMDGDAEMIGYLQRAVGYTLTASTGEQCLFFVYGGGANGKSVFLEILQALLGEHAAASRMDSFSQHKSGGIPNDIARLAGARMVAVGETSDGQRLHESLVKDLTGGDTITARFLHREFFDFRPQFKLWIRGNHKPQIRGTDDGIWRRIHLVPFSVQIPEQERDAELLTKLKAELPGILAWAVRGCLAWQREGLRPPEQVCEATKAYRQEMDILGTYLEDRCVMQNSASVSATMLYADYRNWCEQAGIAPQTQMRLGLAIAERGFEKGRDGAGRTVYRGVGLKT